MSDIKQSNKQPNYYSILPANVRYDNRLNDSERVIFAEMNMAIVLLAMSISLACTVIMN